MSQPSFGPGTLARQLVVRVGLVVALVAALVSVATLLGVRAVIIDQSDAQLRAVAARQTRPGPPDDRPGGGRDDRRDFGNPIGTLHLKVQGSTVDTATILVEGARRAPSQRVIEQLLAVPTDGHPHSVQLQGLGPYRAVATQSGDVREVSAVSIREQSAMLRHTAWLAAAITALAVLASVLVTREVVRRSLRPLNRLAATAREVSELELDRGEVALPVRVAETDPRSEVGRVGQALNTMLNHVEEALVVRQASEQKVRQFVADASHELRNPLASIRGYAELTRRDRDALPAPTAMAMGRIEAESARMSSLVEDLLLLARLDNDPHVVLAPVDVVELVLGAVTDARAAGPDHVWRVDLPEEPVMALADSHRLVQVVVNLLSNARQHTPAGTTVTTRVGREDAWAVVRVTDDGPGIPDAVRDHVFERFAKADVARAHSAEPSTGLGLAIAQAVMSAHGGSVEVASRAGETTFTLRFRLA